MAVPVSAPEGQHTTQVNLPGSLWNRVAGLAQKNGRTVEEEVAWIVQQYVEGWGSKPTMSDPDFVPPRK